MSFLLSGLRFQLFIVLRSPLVRFVALRSLLILCALRSLIILCALRSSLIRYLHIAYWLFAHRIFAFRNGLFAFRIWLIC